MRIEKEGKLKTSHLFSPRTFGSSRELVARAVAGGGGAGAVGIRKDSRTRTGRLLLGEYLGLLLTSQPLLHGCLSYGVPHGADGQVRGVEEEVTVLLLQEERFGSVKGRSLEQGLEGGVERFDLPQPSGCCWMSGGYPRSLRTPRV